MAKKQIKVEDLIYFIKFILQRHPAGLSVLLGRTPPPDIFDLWRMKQTTGAADLGVRVKGGTFVCEAELLTQYKMEIDDVVNACGGWERIYRAFQEYRQKYPEFWDLFEAYALFIKPGGSMHTGAGGNMAILERKFGRDRRSLSRWRKVTFETLANYVLSWQPGDEEFHLKG